MNKNELAEQIAYKLKKHHVSLVLYCMNEILELMSESLIKKEHIEFRGFGSFDVKTYEPKRVRNPKTGEKFIKENRLSIRFKPGRTMKRCINATR